MKSARWTRKIVMGKAASSGRPEIDKDVWDVTKDELSKSWLSGPFTEDELRLMLGPMYVVSRRFGINQNDKVRQIDDLSASLVNASFSVRFKVDLGGIDEAALVAKMMLEAVGDDRSVTIRLSDGRELKGKLHESLSPTKARDLVGRTLDLDAAYKQIPIAMSSRWASVLRIHNFEKNVDQNYVAEALPFGASASVYSFNRFSRALRVIGTRLFRLVWTCYFDDFICFDLHCMSSSSQSTAEELLTLLGWRFSLKEKKRKPFAKSFEALGVVFDLSGSVQNVIRIQNKEARQVALDEAINEIEKSKSCPQSRAASLRGAIQFSEGQLFGE